jgi:hypothetical protein
MSSSTAPLLLSLLFAAAPAAAGEQATALDLDLPQPQLFSGTSSYQDDPPGTYYGDTSGDPAPVARYEPDCPTAPDGSERSMTGSFTTGIGYSSRGGNSNFNAANLNFCKGFVGDDGSTRTLNLNIDVERYDGPGYYGDYGRGRGWHGGSSPRR